MKTTDLDINFVFLIMILAIVLLSAITGFSIGRNACVKESFSKLIWDSVFLLLSMVLLALALLFPYMIHGVGHAAIILSLLKIASFIYYYTYDYTALLRNGSGLFMGEILSTLLVLASGLILVKTNFD